MMSRRSRFLFIVLAVALACTAAGYGQVVSGTISGIVTDPDGNVLPDASVTATNIATGVARQVKSNSEGNYSISFLTPGTYRIEASNVGFAQFVRENITVEAASTARVDIPLRVGASTEKVSVTAQAPELQTENGEISTTLNTKQLQELPSSDRNYQDLISLLPGTGRPEQNFTDIGSDDTRLTSINGLDKYTNNYEIDGLDNNDVILGNTFQVPSVGSIQEVKVVTSNYDAEFGRAGGAVISVQTQSGTNQLHGSLYGFHRDTFLAARRAQPLEDSIPENVNNLYGASIGGPLVRNRAFFFGDFQGINRRQHTAELLSVPIQAFREGDFSSVLGDSLGITDPAGNMIYSGSLFDPLSGNPDGTGRLVFPGNIIPSERFNSQALQIISALPAPNLEGLSNNYLIDAPQPRDTYSFDVRSDQALTGNTNLFEKYSIRNTRTNDYSSAGVALRPDGFLNGLGHLRAQTISANLVHAFGTNTAAELRFGVNRYHYDYAGQDERTADDFGITGLDSGAPLPLISFYDGTVTNVGFSPYYPLVNNQTTYQVSTTWTGVKGAHRVKWGADFRHLDLYRLSRSSNTGAFYFYNNITRGQDDEYVDQLEFTEGGTFAAFLLGMPDQVMRNELITPPHDLGNNLFLFGQDTWRVSNKLTLNYGLRWEYYAPVTAAKKAGAANYDPETGRLLIAGLGNVSNAADVKPYYKNFAPRFGFAYALSPKTVLRGGYGLSYSVHAFGGYGAFLSINFPNVAVQTAGELGSAFPGGTLSEMIPLNLPELPSDGIYDPAPPDQNFYALAFHTKFPYVQSFDLALQRELLPDLTLEIAYVGNKGTDLFDNYHELNYSPPGSGDDGGALFKKFGFEGSVLEAGFNASSIYNSLQVKLNKRMSHGLGLTAAYTWQRGIGYIYGSNFPVETRVLGRGPNTNKQQFVTAQLWELPFGRGKRFLQSGVASKVFGGWQYNGILSVYSGLPFSVLASPTLLDGVRLSRNPAELVDSPTVLGGTGPGRPWFDISAFAEPPVGQYGNAGAQLLYGPPFFNYNASLFRSFNLDEKRKLELRMEVFNLTNTPHWTQPQSNIDRPAFGEILSDMNDARRVQFGATFTY